MPNTRVPAGKARILALVIACASLLVLTGTSRPDTGPPLASSVFFSHVVIDSFPPRDLHAKTVGDIDGDGFDDVIAASADTRDGIFWYANPSWSKHQIVAAFAASFSTDMQATDVDGDGDLDIVVPKRNSVGDRNVWWYENPRPAGDPAVDPWSEHYIGEASAHNLEVADIDKNGLVDVVVREDSTKVFFQSTAGTWNGVVVSGRADDGLALGDIDRDGDSDIAINGYWLRNPLPAGDPAVDIWSEYEVDTNWPSQVGVHIADVNGDARPDIVIGPSESENDRLSWYDAGGDPTGLWTEHVIDGDVSYLHTFKTADMDLDGDLDVVTAEMEQSSDPDEVTVYFNDGEGLSWTPSLVAGTGSHNIRLTDIDEDGDTDIVGANWLQQQVLEMWVNRLDPNRGLDAWQRHVIDSARPWTAVLIAAADVDRDNLKDVVTGGWWYKNPGTPGDPWVRAELGTPLRNMAAVHDFDRDGDLDVLGTRGVGASANDSLVWAVGDGAGGFTILENIDVADGDFLQGVAVAPFLGSGRPQVILSWHGGTPSVQRLTPPADPTAGNWVWDEISLLPQDEDLSAGDIDRDGDADVFQGTRWLRNDSTSWTSFQAHATGDAPDRNRLADINRDGRLDAVVGYEAISTAGRLAWYEQGADPTASWTEHVISTSVVGPMSLDVADMDSDGDWDVVVGEHNLADPNSASLFVFENTDGSGTSWTQHTVYTGDEHHDGAHVADFDNDGDMDIVSIGWGHDRVVVYENLASAPNGGGVSNSAPVASLSATPTSGESPLNVSFDASASFDPDADPLLYTWDFGDGAPPDSGVTVAHVYNADGVFNVKLTVSDGQFFDTEATTIGVGGIPGPTAGLIHHWRFDEGTGTSAGDSVGGAHGTLSGGPTWDATGRKGSALRCDGSAGTVEVGAIDVVGDGLTLALWFKADDFGVPDGRFITKATGTANEDHYWMLSTIDQTALRLRLKINGTTQLLVTSTGEIEAGRWYHVAATYDGHRMRIYKNGVEVASQVKNGDVSTDGAVTAAIGNQPLGAGSLPFDGLIDDVRIYDRALSQAQVDSLVTYALFADVVGDGVIERDPSQVDYVAGSTITLTAVPDPGWMFAGWSGGLAGASNPDSITLAGDTAITATFAPDTVTIDTAVTGGGAIALDPSKATYFGGDIVSFNAVPDPGWTFTGWSGGLAGTENPEAIMLVSDTSVTAAFSPDSFTVTTFVSGNGTVAKQPDLSSYLYGDTVVVTAVADSGWAFYGWSGDLNGGANPDTVVVGGDAFVTGTFVPSAGVPTVGEYGMLALLTMMLAVGIRFARRRALSRS